MKISLFTFLRNGVSLGYPFIESIRSALPLADEYVIALGPSHDGTREALQAIGDARIRIIDSDWNEAMRVAGFVYGQQKMLAQAQCTGDWAFYLEADEVLHEQDLPAIRDAMQRHLGDARVEALVFDYFHFFGSPQWLATSSGWYRRAPRIIRNTIRSVAYDGLFWNVVVSNRRTRWPRAALAGVPIYHYGHVRSMASMGAKSSAVAPYWGESRSAEGFRYTIDPQALSPFRGSHPQVMREWLATQANLEFAPDPHQQPTRKERRHRLAARIERLTGWDLSKKHYTLVV
jgi:hypothetical protein